MVASLCKLLGFTLAMADGKTYIVRCPDFFTKRVLLHDAGFTEETAPAGRLHAAAR